MMAKDRSDAIDAAVHHGLLPATYDAALIGEMCQDKLLALVRAMLFAPFANLRQRRKLGASAVPHPRDRHGQWTCGPEPEIRWATLPHPELTDSELITWRLILSACALASAHELLVGCHPIPTPDTRIHMGRCTRCGRFAGEASALVTASWAGISLSREYLL